LLSQDDTEERPSLKIDTDSEEQIDDDYIVSMEADIPFQVLSNSSTNLPSVSNKIQGMQLFQRKDGNQMFVDGEIDPNDELLNNPYNN